jgi:brefeldin A-inhibited guanine nucleotide-exchange protein
MEKSMLLSSSRVGAAASSSSSTASSVAAASTPSASAASASETTTTQAANAVIQKVSSHDDESPHELPPTSSVAVSVNMVELFDKKQRLSEEIDTGILKFNLSPKKGLSYLFELGHVVKSPVGVAAFLRTYQDRLDKTTVGEYLGREREYEGGFCLKVLHEYVEMMDFEGMAFDIAIRYFLSGFRLPGEAQKIDRLMEKFAERYFIQNRDTFASADMAFILAFSTIMLQTNLHNPAIKDDKRMTKEQFIKQNKGISADGELPDMVRQ